MRIPGPDERVRDAEHCGDAERLVAALECGAGDHHLAQLRVQREVAHDVPDARQVPVVVQSAEVVEELQGAHQRLGRGRVHEVKVHEIVDAQLLHLEHHAAEVAPQYFGVGLLDQVTSEGHLNIYHLKSFSK